MNKNKMKKLNQAILITLVSLSSIQSFAQSDKLSKNQKLVQNSVVVEKNYSSSNGGLIQVGSKDNSIENTKLLKGFANNLPLLTVMKQITPNGWIVKKNDQNSNKLDIKQPISWEGGKNWLETLIIIANNYGINVVVNWDEKTITLSNVPKVEIKKAIFELEDNTTQDVKTSSSDMESSTQKLKEEIKNENITWELSSTKSLKENVAAWAEKAGYRLVWTGEDYSVIDSTMSAINFEGENGIIKQLSIDYGPNSRAQNPLSFQFYQNKTLVVENWLFEQSGYPQFNKKD